VFSRRSIEGVTFFVGYNNVLSPRARGELVVPAGNSPSPRGRGCPRPRPRAPCRALLTVQSFSLDTYCKTLISMDQRPGFRLCQPRRNSVTSSTPRCRLATGRPDHRPRRQRLVVARRPRRTSDRLGFDSLPVVQLWVRLGIDMGELSQSLQSAQFIAYTRGPRPVSQPMRGPVYARRFQLISQPAG
jgi:hypothetical protein